MDEVRHVLGEAAKGAGCDDAQEARALAAQPKLVRVAATTALFGLALCCVPAFLSFLALLPVLARLQMGELPKPRGPHAVSFVDVELPIGGDLENSADDGTF